MTSSFLKKQKATLVTLRGGKCELCGSKPETLTLHHVVHKSYGGVHDLRNLILSCWSCHTKIHNVLKAPSGTSLMELKILFEKNKKTKKVKQNFNNNSNSNRRYNQSVAYRAA